MTITDLIKYRLANQQLLKPKFTEPDELVGYFGAMQAQDYAMAKWAVGVRTGATEKTVEHALNNGDIVRTHVLRPTWHFVAAADVRWMLQLTAARIKAAFAAMSRQLELDDKTLVRCNGIIEKALTGNKHLTREEIMQELGGEKILSNEMRSTIIMMHAEQDGIVCNGTMRGKQHTYALLEEKIPATKTLTKDEAMALLAKKYFTSHGPATLHDFSWWSGLPLGQVRGAVETIKDTLLCEQTGEQTYWFDKGLEPGGEKLKGVHFLPAFDEFMVSYKDRSAVVHSSNTRHVITANGIFKPLILVNGKVDGWWKRSIKGDKVLIETQYFDTTKASKKDILNAAGRYGDFTGRKVVFAN